MIPPPAKSLMWSSLPLMNDRKVPALNAAARPRYTGQPGTETKPATVAHRTGNHTVLRTTQDGREAPLLVTGMTTRTERGVETPEKVSRRRRRDNSMSQQWQRDPSTRCISI